MKWNVLAVSEKRKAESDEIVNSLLKNRGILTKQQRGKFLNPAKPEELFPGEVGINLSQLKKAKDRVEKAITAQEPIVVYGDYDVDGICSTAIIWETLRDLGAKALPFIPQREKEGYGLSIEGINTVLNDEKYGIYTPNKTNKANKSIKTRSRGLLITVDNGIVADEAIDFANSQGLDVIIIDHHEAGSKLPKATAIIHTLDLCGAGISYVFSNELYKSTDYSLQATANNKLELACIATVADLVPLVGPNRSIVKYGLPAVTETKRPGLRELFKVAGVEKVGTYEIGYLIGPRINASGRLENALTSLRLICTQDPAKASLYANQLNDTNRERQDMTLEMVMFAKQTTDFGLQPDDRIIIVDSDKYHQGIIGLIAGKLVEQYYLPAIVISKGELISKASARSISGFNIIEAVRSASGLLINAGGHPMAAGFTIETTRIADFRLLIADYAKRIISDDMLEKSLKVDLELSLDQYDLNELYESISRLAPYGIGNPEPVFAGKMKIRSLRTVGSDGKHLKLSLLTTGYSQQPKQIDGIAFGMGELSGKLKEGDIINLAYCLALDTFNGGDKIQLKIKDIHPSADSE